MFCVKWTEFVSSERKSLFSPIWLEHSQIWVLEKSLYPNVISFGIAYKTDSLWNIPTPLVSL